MEVDLIPKKGCKRNLVWTGGPIGGKVIFALLTEVIILYVGPTVIDVRGFGLELVSRSTLRSIEECLDDSI